MDFSELEGFDWDGGNSAKNWLKHGVTVRECEEVFANTPLLVSYDERHSAGEERHNALGKTSYDRLLYVSFTIRIRRVRVISARPMSKKDRAIYEQSVKENSGI